MADESPKLDPRLVQLAKETANLPSKVELAKREVKNGMDPRYVAMKYDLDVERFVSAVDAWKQRRVSEDK